MTKQEAIENAQSELMGYEGFDADDNSSRLLGQLFDAGYRAAMETARDAIESQQNPYPADIFLVPTKRQYDKINALVKQAGLSVAGYNGSWGRRVWELCNQNGLESIDVLLDDLLPDPVKEGG